MEWLSYPAKKKHFLSSTDNDIPAILLRKCGRRDLELQLHVGTLEVQISNNEHVTTVWIDIEYVRFTRARGRQRI